MANYFVEYFRLYFSTADVDLSNNFPYQIVNSVSIPNLIISESDVLQALRLLKYTYVIEPDGIPSCILKSCSDELRAAIARIFNLSPKTDVGRVVAPFVLFIKVEAGI